MLFSVQSSNMVESKKIGVILTKIPHFPAN